MVVSGEVCVVDTYDRFARRRSFNEQARIRHVASANRGRAGRLVCRRVRALELELSFQYCLFHGVFLKTSPPAVLAPVQPGGRGECDSVESERRFHLQREAPATHSLLGNF